MPRRKVHTKAVLEGVEVAELDRTALDATRYKPSLTRLSRIFGLWIAANERRWSMTSLTYRQREMRLICEVLGLTEISEIGRKHFQEFIDHRRRRGNADSTISRQYATLVSVLEWSFRQKIIAENVGRTMRSSDYGLPPTHPKGPR
jgi:site-specific recombinase XerC